MTESHDSAPAIDPHTPIRAQRPLSRVFLARLLAEMGRSESDFAATLDTDSSASWQDTLALRCRHAGVRTNTIELSWREAREAVRLALPLVAWDPAWGWLSLLEAKGDQVRVLAGEDGAEWLDLGELLSELEIEDPEAPRAWLALEPTTPPGSVSNGQKLSPFRRLSELLRPDRRDLLTIVIYAVFVGLLSLATPIAVQQLVNVVAFGGLVQPVVVLAFLLFAGLAFAGLLSVLQAYLAELIQRRVFVRTCVDLSDRLPRTASRAFEGRHGPELVNRFLDLNTLQKTGATLLLDGSTVALQSLAGLLILSFYHPVMLGFSALLVSSFAFVVFVVGRGATESAVEESSAKYAVAGWLEELARHPSAFRNRDSRTWAVMHADALSASWVAARKRHYRIVLRQIVGSTGLQVFVSTILLAIGGVLVVSGQLTLGQLVASEIIVATVVASFARLGKQLESYYDLLAAADKIGLLLDLPLERDFGRLPTRMAGAAAVEANSIGAHLPASDCVLTDISLTIEPGERLAIEGPSVSGNSTLLEMLCGLRTPESGYVTLDGEDLRELRPEGVRDQIFCVRGPEIFAGTIVDNLRIGRAAASMDELCAALDAVGLLHELRLHADGLDTRLSTNGWPLNSSQMARLMLARAIVAQPRVLALDCAFEHMDDDARLLSLAAVLGPEAPWTALVVSHDRTVLGHCTRTFRLGGTGSDAPEPTEAVPPTNDAPEAEEDPS